MDDLNDELKRLKSKYNNLNKKVKQLDLLEKKFSDVFNDNKSEWLLLINNKDFENILKKIEEDYENYIFKKDKVKFQDVNEPFQKMIFEISPYLNNIKEKIKKNKQLNNINYNKIIQDIEEILNYGPLSVNYTLFNKVHTYEYYFEVEEIKEKIKNIKKIFEKEINSSYKKFIKKSQNKFKSFQTNEEKN